MVSRDLLTRTRDTSPPGTSSNGGYDPGQDPGYITPSPSTGGGTRPGFNFLEAFQRYQQPVYGAGRTPEFNFDRPLWQEYHESPQNRFRTYDAALTGAPGFDFLSPLYQNEARRGFNTRNAAYTLGQYMPLLQGAGGLAPNAGADTWQNSLGGQGGDFDIRGGLGQLWNAYQSTGADRDALNDAGFGDAVKGMLVDAMMQGQTGLRRQYLNSAFQNRVNRLGATRGPEGFDLFNAWRGGRLGDQLGLGFANRAEEGYTPSYLDPTVPYTQPGGGGVPGQALGIDTTPSLSEAQIDAILNQHLGYVPPSATASPHMQGGPHGDGTIDAILNRHLGYIPPSATPSPHMQGGASR